MKTIRKIADEIGVSKQAVYKRYKGKLYTVCAPYAHTEHSIGAPLEYTENDKLIIVLQTTIDTLQGQLAVKDKQIEELNARLAEASAALVAAQQTAQAAQALHAGTIQKQLIDGVESSDDQTDLENKKNWFQRIFSK